jgi:hypothetical protein
MNYPKHVVLSIVSGCLFPLLVSTQVLAGLEGHQEEDTHFEDLPVEIKVEVLSYLGVRDHLNASLVNSTQLSLFQDESYWRSIAQRLLLKRVSDSETYFNLVKRYYTEVVPFLSSIKAKGLATSRYGYEKNKSLAKDLIENGVTRHETWALSLQAEGLRDSSYGYKEDKVRLQRLIDSGVEKREFWALEQRVEELNSAKGCTSFESKIQAKDMARDLIEGGIRLGEEWAFRFKENALKTGLFTYGYRDDKEGASLLLDEAIAKGQTWAYAAKIALLDLGDVQSKAVAKRMIDDGIKNGQAWALEARVFGLKHGRYGFPENRPQGISRVEEGIKHAQTWAFRMKLSILNNRKRTREDAKALIENELEKAASCVRDLR